MVDHETMYRILFDGVTDAISEIEEANYGFAKLKLVKTLQMAEDICFETGKDSPVLKLITSLDTKAGGRQQE